MARKFKILIRRLLKLLRLLNPAFLGRVLRSKRSLEYSLRETNPVRRDLYSYFDNKFYLGHPGYVRKHRQYFEIENRGCGESAFHMAWFFILKHFRPKNLLEIGVYRGQVISLWQLIAREIELEVSIVGVSPFDGAGDSVSNYVEIDYWNDTLKNFEYFDLRVPTLLKALSSDAKAKSVINSKSWDLIYIDGSHDYEDVLNDYFLAKKNLSPGGILCLDDSSLFLDFRIDGKYRGHPGPSEVLIELAMKDLRYLFTVGHNNFFQNTAM